MSGDGVYRVDRLRVTSLSRCTTADCRGPKFFFERQSDLTEYLQYTHPIPDNENCQSTWQAEYINNKNGPPDARMGLEGLEPGKFENIHREMRSQICLPLFKRLKPKPTNSMRLIPIPSNTSSNHLRVDLNHSHPLVAAPRACGDPHFDRSRHLRVSGQRVGQGPLR
jgi:hypothetical protein